MGENGRGVAIRFGSGGCRSDPEGAVRIRRARFGSGWVCQDMVRIRREGGLDPVRIRSGSGTEMSVGGCVGANGRESGCGPGETRGKENGA